MSSALQLLYGSIQGLALLKPNLDSCTVLFFDDFEENEATKPLLDDWDASGGAALSWAKNDDGYLESDTSPDPSVFGTLECNTDQDSLLVSQTKLSWSDLGSSQSFPNQGLHMKGGYAGANAPTGYILLLNSPSSDPTQSTTLLLQRRDNTGSVTSQDSFAFITLPNVIYNMKMEVSPTGQVRGKVWEDGDPEPDYQVSLIDTYISTGINGVIRQSPDTLFKWYDYELKSCPSPLEIFTDYSDFLSGSGAIAFWPVLESDATSGTLTDIIGGKTLSSTQFGSDPIVTLDYTNSGTIAEASSVTVNKAYFSGASIAPASGNTNAWSFVTYIKKPTNANIRFCSFVNGFFELGVTDVDELDIILNNTSFKTANSGIAAKEGTGEFFQLAFVTNAGTNSLYLDGDLVTTFNTTSYTFSPSWTTELCGNGANSAGHQLDTEYCLTSFHEQALTQNEIQSLRTLAGL